MTPEDLKVGAYVLYSAPHKDPEKGRIKSWNDSWVFVVYHCNGDWDDYQNYTAAATPIDCLTLCS